MLPGPKTKASEIWMSSIECVAREPVNFTAFKDLVNTQLKSLRLNEKKPDVPTGKYEYSNADKILDGFTIKIDHIHVTFTVLGPYKNAEPGIWYVFL